MGLLEKIFGIKPKERIRPWRSINSTVDVEGAINASYEKPVVILRFSNFNFTGEYLQMDIEDQLRNMQEEERGYAYYYKLDVMMNTQAINKIESLFDILHETPQFLFIRNGNLVFHKSHDTVSLAGIIRQIREKYGMDDNRNLLTSY